ncbi:MAG: hypothetical protein PHR35_16585 [Kiritimatiellae bacterium]|nr:hypothetical protein [Kiritimatiellia bacterium]
MKRTLIALAAGACMLTGCVSSDSPRRQIEKHLGVSAQGKRVLDEYMFGFTGGAPDMTLVRHELLKHEDMRNLTVGLLMMPWNDELDVEMITTNITPDDLQQVLAANLTRSGSTLVRPVDITNITVQTNSDDRIIGTFDWVVPNLFRGRSRFVAKGNKLEYLGVLRKNHVGAYDCETLFSRNGDIFTSQQWIQTEYFAAIEPTSETTTSLSRSHQIRALQELLIPRGLSRFHWPIRDQALPLVYSGERADRDKVIAILKDSNDWKVTLSGRAVGSICEKSLHVSIEKQIKEMASKMPRHIP